MKPAELAKARGDLVAFAAQMLAPLPRSGVGVPLPPTTPILQP